MVRRGAGFTLIEVLIVVTIIGILASLAIPYVQNKITRAKETTLKEDLFILRDVIDQYYADHGRYPPSLQSLVEQRYIRAVPPDPLTDSTTTWVTVAPPEGDGIYDVKSGSPLKDRTGTPYREW